MMVMTEVTMITSYTKLKFRHLEMIINIIFLLDGHLVISSTEKTPHKQIDRISNQLTED